MAASSKLTVIMHADVVGSTELVQRDEQEAHAQIQTTFKDLGKVVDRYGGSVCEVRGDAVVAEFGTTSAAVSAAVAFQSQRSKEEPHRLGPRLRIGIALGEVVIADGTVTGAGVVLAQRLEQLAEPNGVVVQGSVYEALPKRLPFQYSPLGEQNLKGFAETVRAYEVRLQGSLEVPNYSTADASSKPRTPDSTRTSILVLPFDNLSNDAEQEYFSDGITEDLITALSRMRGLLVIGRNTAFSYKGERPSARRLSSELGVDYIVDGSVRKAGQRIRISAPLIDGQNGSELWAERYDRDLVDIFDVQDEVTRDIASSLPGRIETEELARSRRKETTNLGALEAVLRGMEHYHRATPGDNGRAMEFFRAAAQADPNYARAYGWQACTLGQQFYLGISDTPYQEVFKSTAELLETARALDPNDSEIYRILGAIWLRFGRLEDAEEFLTRATSARGRPVFDRCSGDLSPDQRSFSCSPSPAT